jgi:hypothetical protein
LSGWQGQRMGAVGVRFWVTEQPGWCPYDTNEALKGQRTLGKLDLPRVTKQGSGRT